MRTCKIVVSLILLASILAIGCSGGTLATYTPIPTYTAFPTLISTALPTNTPLSTNKPLPTNTLVPTNTPEPTPTPTPEPTPTPVPSNTAVFDLGEGVTLLISPDQPIAGREVEFTLTGLPSWAPVKVTFTDPSGKVVGWITAAEYFYTPGSHRLYANKAGIAAWKRYGIQDVEGNWRAKLGFDNRNESVSYGLQQLKLSGLTWFHLGPRMNGLIGPEAGVFFSDDVHVALAVDVQARLELVSSQVEEVIGVLLSPVPDVYLVGDGKNLDLLSRATLVDLSGWEGVTTAATDLNPESTSTRISSELDWSLPLFTNTSTT